MNLFLLTSGRNPALVLIELNSFLERLGLFVTSCKNACINDSIKVSKRLHPALLEITIDSIDDAPILDDEIVIAIGNCALIRNAYQAPVDVKKAESLNQLAKVVQEHNSRSNSVEQGYCKIRCDHVMIVGRRVRHADKLLRTFQLSETESVSVSAMSDHIVADLSGKSINLQGTAKKGNDISNKSTKCEPIFFALCLFCTGANFTSTKFNTNAMKRKYENAQ